MNQLATKQSTEVSVANNAMLKQLPPDDFKELLAGYLLKCFKLNMEPLPEPEALGMVVSELYGLIKATWPGCRPALLWATLKQGMAKGGQYRVRINYPTVANWVVYHRVMKIDPQGELSKKIESATPSLNTQANEVLAGLKEYRERVARGEYKPKGRGEG